MRVAAMVLGLTVAAPGTAQEHVPRVSACFLVAITPPADRPGIDDPPPASIVEFVFEPSRDWTRAESPGEEEAGAVAYWRADGERMVAVWFHAGTYLRLALRPTGEGLRGSAYRLLDPGEHLWEIWARPAACDGPGAAAASERPGVALPGIPLARRPEPPHHGL